MTSQAHAHFVSRGGHKLDAALHELKVDVAGRRALDAGASTGGFTDCLLEHGAAEVVAVDVAYGQFDWRLRNDPRVRVVERTNVRSITQAETAGPVDIVAADLSFISLRTVRDALTGICAGGADLVLLVKPQFEAPKEMVERGGVVRDPSVWASCMRSVSDAYESAGCTLLGACASPLTGPKGNREFFLHLRTGDGPSERAGEIIDHAVESAP